MRAKQLIAITVAAMLLVGAGAALGAASPVDQVTDRSADASDTDAPDNNGGAADASDNQDENADGIGPSDGLPEQVPNHVSEIHERIESFLSGSIDSLGESLSSLLGNADAAEENADSATDT